MLVGLGLLHAVTALPRMDEQNILTAQAAQSRDCDAHLEKIGCVDGDWKNAHGHTCADLRKNKNGAPDWVDNDGKKLRTIAASSVFVTASKLAAVSMASG